MRRIAVENSLKNRKFMIKAKSKVNNNLKQISLLHASKS